MSHPNFSNHEGGSAPIVVRYLGSQELANGNHQISIECLTEADFLLLPSGIIMGPWRYNKAWHEAAKSMAHYVAQPPAELSLHT